MNIKTIELTGFMLCVPVTARITHDRGDMLRVEIRPTMVLDTPVGKHYRGHLVDMTDPEDLWAAAQRLQFALDGTTGPLASQESASDYMDVLRQFGAREEAVT